MSSCHRRVIASTLVAAGLAIGLGEDAAKVLAALERQRRPGRMESGEAAGGAPIYVDYAHTPTV